MMNIRKRDLSLIGTAILGLLLATIKVWTASTATDRNSPGEQVAHHTDSKELSDDCQGALCITFLGELSGYNSKAKGRTGKTPTKDDYSSHFNGFLKSSNLVIAGLKTNLIQRQDIGWATEKLQTGDAQVQGETIQRITAVSLANDHGSEPPHRLSKTTQQLGAAGIDWFGASSNSDKSPLEPFRWQQTLNGKVFKLAIFGVSKDLKKSRSSSRVADSWQIATLKTKEATNRIKALRSEDPEVFIVVYPFWGKHYKRATVSQQNNAQGWIDAGADLVVGYGTHMIQVANEYKDRWTVYGIVDFIDESAKIKKMKKDTVPYSAALRLVVKEQKGKLETNIRLYPFHIRKHTVDYQTEFLDVKQFGEAYWRYLTKGRVAFDRKIKRKLIPGNDRYGRFINLK